MAFALQTGQNPGLGKFAPLLRTHLPSLLQNIPMPLQPHNASTFCPLSSEAELRKKKKKKILLILQIRLIRVQTTNQRNSKIIKINGSESALGIIADTGRVAKACAV
jgi:hypothetical protein